MRSVLYVAFLVGFCPSLSWGASLIEQIDSAADQGKYVYVMFYRTNNSATSRMASTLHNHVAASADQSAWVKVNVNDRSNQGLIQKFDASRIPLPAVFGLAPNGAVTGVHQVNVSAQQLQQSMLTPKHADVVKALQSQKIAILCLLPNDSTPVPAGVQQFEGDASFQGQTVRVNASATDAAEMNLFERMQVSSNITSPVVVAFAPPGVFLGKFDANVSGAMIAKKVHESGGCNCTKCQANH